MKGQKFVDAAVRVAGDDAGDHVCQVGLGLEPDELASLDERSEHSQCSAPSSEPAIRLLSLLRGKLRMSLDHLVGPDAVTRPGPHCTVRLLLSFHRVPAELRVLVTDPQSILILGTVVPLIYRFEAIPYLDGHPLWRRPFNSVNGLR